MKELGEPYVVAQRKEGKREAKDDFAQDRTGDVLRVKQMP